MVKTQKFLCKSRIFLPMIHRVSGRQHTPRCRNSYRRLANFTRRSYNQGILQIPDLLYNESPGTLLQKRQFTLPLIFSVLFASA